MTLTARHHSRFSLAFVLALAVLIVPTPGWSDTSGESAVASRLGLAGVVAATQDAMTAANDGLEHGWEELAATLKLARTEASAELAHSKRAVLRGRDELARWLGLRQ